MMGVLQILRADAGPRHDTRRRRRTSSSRSLTELIDQAHARLDELVDEIVANDDSTEIEEQRDVLRSMPGIGRIVLATLLAEATQALTARDYHTLRILTGVAPVTWSGKSYDATCATSGCGMYRARVAIQHDAASPVGATNAARATDC